MIPAYVHFCWIGSKLPWAYVYAALSAADTGGMERIYFHCTDELEDGPQKRALTSNPKIILSRLNPEYELTIIENLLGISSGRILDIYNTTTTPVQRANILRIAILYRYGGIYLDTDTITTASLRPLLADGTPFIGAERIVWPPGVKESKSIRVIARHRTLSLIRKIFRHIPKGWKGFRPLEVFFPLGLNNAVIGAPPNDQWLGDCLQEMVNLPDEKKFKRFALGTHLMHRVALDAKNLKIYNPSVFYPVPPEISEHIFEKTKIVNPYDIIYPETCIVHWYASVRTKERVNLISPSYIHDHKEQDYFSALVAASIQNLPNNDGNFNSVGASKAA